MSIFALLAIIVVIGLAVYVIYLLPIPQPFKTMALIVGIICAAIYVLSAFGVFHGADVPVPQVR